MHRLRCSGIFECLVSYVIYLHALKFIYSVCTAHAVPWWEQKFSKETMCVCRLLLGRIISLVKNAQYASIQSKRGQPKIYRLMLSRVFIIPHIIDMTNKEI